ncbi:kinase-like domain-containing protein, partial [Gigaspora rosea]
FNKFANIKYLAQGCFGTVFKAVWTDGYITGWDYKNDKLMRKPQIEVCLKSLNNSKDINQEFLKEVKNQHKSGGNSAIAIYGITKNPKDDNYMMVMHYAKQRSLRKLLNNKYNELNWTSKIIILNNIADSLNTIHQAKLVHKNFHPGNIVNENIYMSYITDVGLCKPVSRDSSSDEIYGILPYIDPIVLCRRGNAYIEKSDIYSFGVIMSEIFTGYPPYYDIPHDDTLATSICLGLRPRIICKVPQLLLDLMSKCLDAESQNRPTADKIANTLNRFYKDLNNEKTELCNQIKQIENSSKNFSTFNQMKSERLYYQTDPKAIYTSRLLHFPTLPKQVDKPINAGKNIVKKYNELKLKK